MHTKQNICAIINRGDITTIDGTPLKLVDKFTYLGSSVASTEKGHRHEVNESMDSYQ